LVRQAAPSLTRRGGYVTIGHAPAGGITMPMRAEVLAATAHWRSLTAYRKFEHIVVMIVTALIAVVIVVAVWNLTLKILLSLLRWQTFDPADHAVFQTVFGMIFTVIIALEFKRSLLVVAERGSSIVQVRTVILLAMLAVVRKLIILDLSTIDSSQLVALAVAILALGIVYWLVRDQERRERGAAGTSPTSWG
jgi:uncharacterized membrane protein (DUF373 family)